MSASDDGDGMAVSAADKQEPTADEEGAKPKKVLLRAMTTSQSGPDAQDEDYGLSDRQLQEGAERKSVLVRCMTKTEPGPDALDEDYGLVDGQGVQPKASLVHSMTMSPAGPDADDGDYGLSDGQLQKGPERKPVLVRCMTTAEPGPDALDEDYGLADGQGVQPKASLVHSMTMSPAGPDADDGDYGLSDGQLQDVQSTQQGGKRKPAILRSTTVSQSGPDALDEDYGLSDTQLQEVANMSASQDINDANQLAEADTNAKELLKGAPAPAADAGLRMRRRGAGQVQGSESEAPVIQRLPSSSLPSSGSSAAALEADAEETAETCEQRQEVHRTDDSPRGLERSSSSATVSAEVPVGPIQEAAELRTGVSAAKLAGQDQEESSLPYARLESPAASFTGVAPGDEVVAIRPPTGLQDQRTSLGERLLTRQSSQSSFGHSGEFNQEGRRCLDIARSWLQRTCELVWGPEPAPPAQQQPAASTRLAVV